MFFKKNKASRYTSTEPPEKPIYSEVKNERFLELLTDEEKTKIQEKFRRKAFKKKAKALGWDIG